MNDKISIIVPIYKCEKYLDRCVESLVNQTHTNLEIILVDDGSPDNSPKMCEEWAKRDARVRVIHKENGGASSARNTGLDNITGNYITFVDGDDFINETMCEKLLNALNKDNHDVSMCGYNFYYSPDKIIRIKEMGLKQEITLDELQCSYIMNDWNCTSDEYTTNNLIASVWRVLYKAELLKNVRFSGFKFSEDTEFNLKAIKPCHRITSLNENLYNYVQSEGSVLRAKTTEKRLEERINSLRKVAEAFGKYSTKEYEDAYKFLVYRENYLMLLSERNKPLLKKFKKDKRVKELKAFKNFKANCKITHSFKNIIKNILVLFGCDFILKTKV